MILFPHAKINVGLDIIRRRPDGYHDIVTAMIPTDWEDVLELTPSTSGETTLTVTGRAVDCPAEKNLVMKAFRAMEALTGGLPPTDIRLHKIIPDGAGLGGGSADTAFTIRGLNELYNLGLPDEELLRVAAMIGADCPFFIADRPMLCSGIGTDMVPIDLPQLQGLKLAIVKPPESVSTAQAYAGVSPYEPKIALGKRLELPVGQWQGVVGNAFEASVFEKCPRVAAVKEHILELGAIYSSMSGSGSAVFGLFRDYDTDKLSELLVAEFPDCVCHVGHV